MDKSLARICVRIYQEDYDFIREMASAAIDSSGGGFNPRRANSADTNISANRIIREIISTYVRQIRANQRDLIDKIPQNQPISIEVDPADPLAYPASTSMEAADG